MTSRADPVSPGGRIRRQGSPHTGGAAAPVNVPGTPPYLSPTSRSSPTMSSSSSQNQSRLPHRLLAPMLSSRSNASSGPPASAASSTTASSSFVSSPLPPRLLLSPPAAMRVGGRSRSRSRDAESLGSPPSSPLFGSPGTSRKFAVSASPKLSSMKSRRKYSDADSAVAKARAKSAQMENDSMVYLDGPGVYTCAQCRTHLTSHDDIISKSFHGRHGRAYLFDQCVNVTVGPAEDRLLITGMHSVCDIFCRRCNSMVGWTYAKAYEASQKYKEGKFIIEKINLHLEESNYDVSHPAGERGDRWRKRSMSWGSEQSMPSSPRNGGDAVVYEYKPGATSGASYQYSPRSPSTQAERVGTAPVPSGSAKPNVDGRLPSPPYL